MNVAEFKQQTLKEYLEWVDEVSDVCEWKTHFTPEEIVSKVVDIVLERIKNEVS